MAGGVRHRSQAQQGRHHHHAVLYLLRGGRPHARRARGQPVSLLRTIRAVAWSFVGLRKSSGLEEDTRIHPLHVVAVGIAAVVVLVLGLMLLVRWMV
ncbi:DUF2970 domain-containing protein [Xylophilus sp. Kf1]|nr:DUF2970 domain-containing protein [Xylophilus sp. Kf1]